MPAQRADQLTPITFADFSSGLWERGDRECPPNGLLECTDVMPLPSGGVRAAWAWKEEPIGNFPKNRRVMGFQVDRGGAQVQDIGTISVGLMLGTTNTTAGPFTYEYWFARARVSLGDMTTWTSGMPHSSIQLLWPVRFEPFLPTTAVHSWYYNVAEAATTNQTGVWKLENTLESTIALQVFSSNTVFVAQHQDRLVYVTGSTGSGGTGPYTRLQFTAPGSDVTPPTSNWQDVAAYRPGNITYLSAVYPQDLFVLKQNLGGAVVQGDLGAGAGVREIFAGHAPERMTWGARLPMGMAYMTEHEGVWMWSGGSNPVHISPQFQGTPMTSATLVINSGAPFYITDGPGFLGELGYGGSWLFTPKGYIFDIENNWWFKSTLPGTGIYTHWSYDPIGRQIYGAGYKEPGDDVRIVSTLTDTSTMQRAGEYSITLPIIDTTERNVEVRRVEIFGQGFGNGGTWTLEVTTDRGAVPISQIGGAKDVAAGPASVRFDLSGQGDWLKLRVVSTGNAEASSPTGKSEAPSIAKVVLWVRPRQTRPS